MAMTRKYVPGMVVDGATLISEVVSRGTNRKWLVRCQCGRICERWLSKLIQGTSHCRDCAPRLGRQAKKHRVGRRRMTAAEIASEVGVVRETIYARARLGQNLAAPKAVGRHKRVYGMSLGQMAEIEGVTREAIRQRIERNGTPWSQP